MPLLKTLYEPIEYKTDEDRGIKMPVDKLVMLLSKMIITDNPDLVIRAYSDEQSVDNLRRKIIELMDSGKYYYTGGRSELMDRIFDFMFGYGALQKYIDDNEITDIDGTAYNEFSITRNGLRSPVDVNFGDEKTFDTYCRLVAVRSGGFINDDDTHCRTTDLNRKLRINVSIPPRNISGPAISIRKHPDRAYRFRDLEKAGMLDSRSKEIIENAATSENSILICGKGASGKTTLLRTFINSIPELERVLVVESDAEIFPEKKFTIEQRTKKPGEGGKPVNLEMLIKDGLTMSLDSYCIGEIVGDEAYSFIKASCTGHRMMGTIHSVNAKEALPRLVSLAMGAASGDSVGRTAEAAATGIHLIVFLRKFRVLEILRTAGYDGGKFKYECLYEGGAG